jgi:beta-glucosidase
MKKTGKIIWGVVFGCLGLSAMAADIAAGYFSEAISIYLGGYGIQFDALNVEQGNTLCQNIEGEGLVLLKNKNEPLPLKDLKKINVFGWCGSNGGFIDSGAGSGSSGERGSGNKQTLLDAFASKGIETNPTLNSFYSSFSAVGTGVIIGRRLILSSI